jgi:molybdopterin/thiamine biosynthesis adenylyltransferase
MRLSGAQQERYARHLLLDDLGGEGQERLLAACVRIRGTGRAARWAARYLAASGVGTLLLDDVVAARECSELSPDARTKGEREPDLTLELADAAPSGGPTPAEQGAAAALAALRHLVQP